MDCEKFSPKAQEIFNKLKEHYPPDPWEQPNWKEEGLVYANGWLDLRKAADRKKLMEKQKSFIGYLAELAADAYRRKHGSLDGFNCVAYGQGARKTAEQLLLLNDLDFQVETMDLVEG